MSNHLKGAVVTVTGGTGSFGNTMVRSLLQREVKEIRVFSRDENKQELMRNDLKDERIRFFLGDVRDYSSVEVAIKGTDFVFHAAALKQVPSCEFFPMQAAATNLNGSSNVIDASIKNEVRGIVCLSSDKAVYPINAMGMSKALMEKVAQSYVRNYPNSETRIAITRYGNVMMSRGSVIPLLLEQALSGNPLTITNPEMTRFMMSLGESVSLVDYAFSNATSGDLYVRKASACTVGTLAIAIAKIVGMEGKLEIKNIGTRHGEKLYESLLGVEERARAIDHGDYFRVPLDSRSLDYQIYFNKGQSEDKELDAYTSHNTNQLTVDEVVSLVTALPEFQPFRSRIK